MHELDLPHPTAECLADFGLGRLGAAESAQVAAHIAGCDACREVVENLPPDRLVGLLQGAGETAPGPPGTGSPTGPADAPRRGLRPWHILVLAAILAAVLIGLAVYLVLTNWGEWRRAGPRHSMRAALPRRDAPCRTGRGPSFSSAAAWTPPPRWPSPTAKASRHTP